MRLEPQLFSVLHLMQEHTTIAGQQSHTATAGNALQIVYGLNKGI